MGLFDSINFSVQTKSGAFSLNGGKVGIDVGGGLSPATPTPLTPSTPNPGSTGPVAWIMANPKTAAAIAGGALLAILLARR
jgi:hypothetical protein